MPKESYNVYLKENYDRLNYIISLAFWNNVIKLDWLDHFPELMKRLRERKESRKFKKAYLELW